MTLPKTYKKRKITLPQPQKTAQMVMGCYPVKIIDVGLSIYPINYNGTIAMFYKQKEYGACVLIIGGRKMTFNKPELEMI